MISIARVLQCIEKQIRDIQVTSVVSGENEFTERTDEEESRLSKQWCEILFNAMRKLMNHKKVQVIVITIYIDFNA